MSNLNELISNGIVKLKTTNADNIRKMSDKELAEFLDKISNDDRLDWNPIGCNHCVYYQTHHSVKGSSQYMCKDCCYEDGLLTWLQSEVSDGN